MRKLILLIGLTLLSPLTLAGDSVVYPPGTWASTALQGGSTSSGSGMSAVMAPMEGTTITVRCYGSISIVGGAYVYGSARIYNGQLQVRAYRSGVDSGWKNGYYTAVDNGIGYIRAWTGIEGVKVQLDKDNGCTSGWKKWPYN